MLNPVCKILSFFSLLIVFASCSLDQQEYQISFAARFGLQPITCSVAANNAELTDLRFYVTDVFLVRNDGTEVRLALVPDGQWQDDSLALIDLEDGTGSCQNGTTATNFVMMGRAPKANYQGLRFTVGVPEARNHGDPLLASAPLTDSAMHWHWRSGYKFLRTGFLYNDERFRLHLGSARCHGVIGNLKGCDESNRAHVSFAQFNASNDVVVIDLAVLQAGFAAQHDADRTCEMGPDELACATFRSSLGLDAAGNSVESASVFRVESEP